MVILVLAIDAVKGFCDRGNMQNPRMKNIIPNIEDLMERVQKKREGDIIFVCDNHQEDDPEFKRFPKHCIVGTEEVEVVPQLRRFLMAANNNYVPKTKFNALLGNRLKESLARIKPDRIIIVGVCTDICILYTVAALRELEYEVIVPKDCVETFDAPDHNAEDVNNAMLKHMADILGVEIVPTQAGIGI